MYQEDFYPESRFGGFTDIDGTVAFYARVRELLGHGSTVLDVGCGPGSHSEDPVQFRRNLRDLRGKARKVIGIDIASRSKQNPTLDEFRLIEEKGEWPVSTDSIDLALADWVLEHIARPERFIREMARVVRPGGYICVRTPNLLSYFGLISSLIPDRFHAKITGIVQENRKEEDVYPTHYRCNIRWKLQRLLEDFGFDALVYGYESEPAYLSFSKFAYWLGVLHQRFAPRLFRLTLFGFAKNISDS